MGQDEYFRKEEAKSCKNCKYFVTKETSMSEKILPVLEDTENKRSDAEKWRLRQAEELMKDIIEVHEECTKGMDIKKSGICQFYEVK